MCLIMRLETAFIEHLAIFQRDKINYYERNFMIPRCYFTRKEIKPILKKESDNSVNVIRKFCAYKYSLYIF